VSNPTPPTADPTPVAAVVRAAGCRVEGEKCRVGVGLWENYTPTCLAYLWGKVLPNVGCVGLYQNSTHVKKRGKREVVKSYVVCRNLSRANYTHPTPIPPRAVA
jgi:hypothetical protein